jgi:hypothetical protein
MLLLHYLCCALCVCAKGPVADRESTLFARTLVVLYANVVHCKVFGAPCRSVAVLVHSSSYLSPPLIILPITADFRNYRGTASKRQMEANLKYKQRAIVFSDLTTSTLDHLDGLTIKHGAACAVPSLSLCTMDA